MRKICVLIGWVGCVYSLTLTKIPPMPDIDQIQTDEEWAAMMEEYEAVQALRGAIMRGEITLQDATTGDLVAVPLAGGASVPFVAPVAAVAMNAAPVAPMVPMAPVAAVPVAPVAPVAAVAAAPYAPMAVAAAAAVPAVPVMVGGALAQREEAVAGKVSDMMNAASDDEWNKMMEQYNKALQANPVDIPAAPVATL